MCRMIPLAAVLCLLLAACSNDTQRGPASPDVLPSWPMATRATSSHRTILGLWTIAINDDHSEAEVVPLRTAELHFNTVRLLEVTPCKTCLAVERIVSPGPELIDVDVTMRHPFPGMLKYTGFDVRGIFISKADYAFPPSGRSIAWGSDAVRLLNYDGYTHLFNPSEFPEDSPGPPALHYITGRWSTGGDLTSTLNPFVAYRKDAPRRMFEPGVAETKTFRIHAPAGPMQFGYAVDASWQLAKDVVDPLNDFPLSANCLEPYEIIVNAGTGLMPDEGAMTGVEVRVFDHQGLQTITSASVFAPQLFDGEVSLELSANNGEPYSLFGGVIRNGGGVGMGTYPLLVRVTDEGDDPNLGPVDAWQVYPLEVRPRRGWATTWGDHGGIMNIDLLDRIEVDKLGNSIVTMYVSGQTALYDGLWKLDPEGRLLWEIEFPEGIIVSRAGLVSDEEGNIYLTDYFGGNVDFDPGPGEDFHDSGTGWDAYLTKFDGNGNRMWTRTWGGDIGMAQARGLDIALDNAGHVYVVGSFLERVDFDPGPGEYFLESFPPGADHDAFLSVFDGDGSWIRAASWGGPGWESCLGVTVDKTGSIHLTGGFEGSADFDPGLSQDYRASNGGRDCFLSKLDCSGQYQWVRTWGSEYDDDPAEIAAEIAGSLYALGTLEYPTDLDPGPGEDIRDPENGGIYLSCFGPDGEYRWALQWGDQARGLAATGFGEIYVVGHVMSRDVDVDPGPDEMLYSRNANQIPMHLNKINSTGESIWVRVWEEPGGMFYSGDVDADPTGNAYVAGFFGLICDFDPGLGFDYHVPSKHSDVFVTMMPPDGYW